jgi:acetylornithine deacetylase/succinyl-diaminopimelate desuccinylase-like protein
MAKRTPAKNNQPAAKAAVKPAGKSSSAALPAVEEVLSDLIRIPSVNPPGGEIAVAHYLKRLCDIYNIPNEIIEPVPGRASFIATLGEGEKSMLFLSHEDVVPASEGWDFPPFSGLIKDGFVHGRGAIDCKGLVAVEVCALIQLAKSKKLNGKLIFAAVADEEVGGDLGAGILSAKYPEKIRADFAVNEGDEPLTINGKTYHSISVGEKGPAWMKLTTKGISSHGSVPMLEQNAVVKMAKIIAAMSKYRPQIVLTPETKSLLQTIATINGVHEEVTEDNLDFILDVLKDRTVVPYLSAITRMTISPDVIHGGVKTNIVPDSCEAQVDIRILPGQSWEYVLNELKLALGDVKPEPLQYHMPSFSSANSKYFRLVEETLKEYVGDGPILQTICTGATDSRYLREMDVPSFGIGVLTLNMDKALSDSVHGKNEKIDIASLRLKTEFLVKLATKYLS